MGHIVDWDEVVDRYSRVGDMRDGAAAVSETYIAYAEAELEGRLGPYYTVPFSDNNLTAKDLAIDMTYANIIKGRDAKKYEPLRKMIDSRIDNLIAGRSLMVTTSGDTMVTAGGSLADSTTKDYHPTFGMEDYEYSWVSSDMLQAEEDARLG